MKQSASLAVVLVVGCGGEALDAPVPIRATGRPIFHGTLDTNPAHMAVVALTDSLGFFCSGTLIAPDVVLSAAHCLDGSLPGETQIFFGQDVNTGGTYRDIAAWEIYSLFDDVVLTGDVGVIRLASPAPSGVTPIPHLPAALGLTTADAGRIVEFSGFGVTETQSSGAKLHVNGTISVVCSGPGACANGDVVAKAFAYDQSAGGPCSGDSGGPAFLVRGATEYVAGVTSYGDRACTDFGVSTTVSEYASWIEAFIFAGGVETCGNGIDDDGDGFVDCADSSCADDATCVGPNACGSAAVVGCGTVLDATTVGGATAFTTSGCAQTVTSRWNGPEVAFELQALAGTQVTARIQPTAGDLDLFWLPALGDACSTAQCLAASTEAGTAAETLTFTADSAPSFLLVDTWEIASAFSLTITCIGVVEQCDNGIDDDGDGVKDCADSDCAATPGCQVPVEQCDNGIDDDGDGVKDCADSDCAATPGCQVPVEQCDNGIDDDGDGVKDCADADCSGWVGCQNAPPGGTVPGSSRRRTSRDEEGGCNMSGAASGWTGALAFGLLLAGRWRQRRAACGLHARYRSGGTARRESYPGIPDSTEADTPRRTARTTPCRRGS